MADTPAGCGQLYESLGLRDTGRTTSQICHFPLFYWPRAIERTESTVRATGGGTAGLGDYSTHGGEGALWQDRTGRQHTNCGILQGVGCLSVGK